MISAGVASEETPELQHFGTTRSTSRSCPQLQGCREGTTSAAVAAPQKNCPSDASLASDGLLGCGGVVQPDIRRGAAAEAGSANAVVSLASFDDANAETDVECCPGQVPCYNHLGQLDRPFQPAATGRYDDPLAEVGKLKSDEAKLLMQLKQLNLKDKQLKMQQSDEAKQLMQSLYEAADAEDGRLVRNVASALQKITLPMEMQDSLTLDLIQPDLYWRNVSYYTETHDPKHGIYRRPKYCEDKRLNMFYLTSPTSMPLSEYFARFHNYFDASAESYVIAYIYLDRLRASLTSVDPPGKHRSHRLNNANIYRFWLAAITLASKYWDDRFNSNKRYALIGGVPLKELNKLEWAFFSLLDFNICVSVPEFQHYKRAFLKMDTNEAAALQALHRVEGLQPLDFPALDPGTDSRFAAERYLVRNLREKNKNRKDQPPGARYIQSVEDIEFISSGEDERNGNHVEQEEQGVGTRLRQAQATGSLGDWRSRDDRQHEGQGPLCGTSCSATASGTLAWSAPSSSSTPEPSRTIQSKRWQAKPSLELVDDAQHPVGRRLSPRPPAVDKRRSRPGTLHRYRGTKGPRTGDMRVIQNASTSTGPDSASDERSDTNSRSRRINYSSSGSTQSLPPGVFPLTLKNLKEHTRLLFEHAFRKGPHEGEDDNTRAVLHDRCGSGSAIAKSKRSRKGKLYAIYRHKDDGAWSWSPDCLVGSDLEGAAVIVGRRTRTDSSRESSAHRLGFCMPQTSDDYSNRPTDV
ncbi:unnamed protein product [Amoebophrya sp. A120]|nr:unnamed protein product [Amoebophrya sp. A120]|eukprot:GSA120T00008003001.1